jgi:hypothetical protein
MHAAEQVTADPEVSITKQSHRRAPHQPGAARGWVGPTLLAVAFVAIAMVAVLGPSAAEAPLGSNDNGATPPWHLGATPPAWLVTALLAIAIIAGLAVLALGLTGRWRPDPRRLLIAGLLASAGFCVLPPIGSADPLSYAAYGRMVVTGHNPWTTSPAQLAAHDRVERAAEFPWQHTPSVYGPFATAEQAAASGLAGENPAVTVLLLDIAGAAVFAGAGLLHHRLANTEDLQRRAAVLWVANPLLWLQLVAGAHLDVLAAGAVLASLAVVPRTRLGAGVLAGLAAAVKAPAGLVWLALIWAYRRSQRSVIEIVAGGIVVAGTGYAIAGRGVFQQLSRASHLVSLGTPWRPIANLTDPALGHGTSRHLIGALALVLFVAIVIALRRVNAELRTDSPAALAFVLTFAYVLAAPYALPWYDAIPWVVLPLLAASRVDGILVAYSGILSLAYIPGRAAYVLHGWLHSVAFGMRELVSPILLAVILLGLALASTQSTARPARLE